MLQIRGTSRERQGDGPAELLLACHARIRAFTALAVQLVSELPAGDSDVADAAQRIQRYFALALPLHQEDEETSIMPALMPVASPELLEALAAMKHQHVELDALANELLPGWEALAREPGRRRELSAGMAPPALRLQTLFVPHLAAEEALIFPALPLLLGAGDLARIAAEMRERRAPPISLP